MEGMWCICNVFTMTAHWIDARTLNYSPTSLTFTSSQVRVLHDFAQASERVKLGRRFYSACATVTPAAATTASPAKTSPASLIAKGLSLSPLTLLSSPSKAAGSGTDLAAASRFTASGIVANLLEYAGQVNAYNNRGFSHGVEVFRHSDEYRASLLQLWEQLR